MRLFSLFFCLVILAAFFSGCTFLVYQPDSYMYSDPEKMHPKPTQYELQGPAGKVIVWKFPGFGNKKTKIILFHGNAQNISAHFYALYWLPQYGYDYYIFDYPGYGGSEGDPNQKNVAETSMLVVDWVLKQNHDSKVAFLGQSLGGNIAGYTAAKTRQKYAEPERLCAVVLDSTFRSYRKVAQTVLAKNWFTWPLQWLGWVLVSEDYSANSELSMIAPVPVMVMHGDQDQAVTYQNGIEVFEALHEPKELVAVPNGQHIDALTGKDRLVYQKKFLDFLKNHCD